MERLAALPNVACKLSGLLTEAGGEDVSPVIEWLFETFGVERLVWGSDWPVLEMAGTYADWLALARSFIPEAGHAAVFEANVRRIYRL